MTPPFKKGPIPASLEDHRRWWMRGEKGPVTAQQRDELHRRYVAGERRADLAEAFGITVAQVSDITRGLFRLRQR